MWESVHHEPKEREMAMEMKDFLYKYFAVLNLKAMPEPILERFNGWVKKDDYPNKDVKAWTKDFPRADQTKWKDSDLPQISELNDEELDNLYILLRDVFRSMAENEKDFRDNTDAKDFVNKYFGTGKTFEDKPLPANIEKDIKEFIKLLTQTNIKNYVDLGYNQRNTLLAVLGGRQSVNSADARSAISDAISDFNRKVAYGEIPENIANLAGSINLDNILTALEPDLDVTKDNRDALRAKIPEIFETLYKKSAVRNVFTEYDPNKTISRQIEQALKRTDYTGKLNEKNFIAPKYTGSTKNPSQWIDKKLKDTYSDVLKKYLTVHRDNVYIKNTAKAIIGTFDKKGIEIQPTDDLNVLIKKSGDIVGKLRGKEPFEAADHMEWLTKKLKAYKDGGLSNDIDGALRWGYQMNRIVKQIIKDAVQEGKVKQAKTALEVLSIMQYGTFTSRTMDAINKTDVNIFSDGGLSWNKNEGIKLVTGALDKTIKFGIQATGYAATGIVNHIRKIRKPLKGFEDLRKLADNRTTELDSERKTAKENTEKANKNDKSIIDNSNTTINNSVAHIQGTYGLDIDGAKNYIKNQEDQMQTLVNKATEAQKEMNTNKVAHEKYIQNDEIVKDFDGIDDKIKDIKKERSKIKREIKKRQAILASKGPYGTYNNPVTKKSMSPTEAEHYEKTLLAEIDNLMEQFRDKNNEIKSLRTRQNDPAEKQKRDEAEANKAQYSAGNKDYLDAQDAINDAQSEHDKLMNDPAYVDLCNQMSQYDAATSAKEKAQNDIDARNKEMDKWDENNKNDCLELMAYWEFLQTGKTKNFIHMNTKKLQQRMDKGEMQAMLSKFTQDYAKAA